MLQTKTNLHLLHNTRWIFLFICEIDKNQVKTFPNDTVELRKSWYVTPSHLILRLTLSSIVSISIVNVTRNLYINDQNLTCIIKLYIDTEKITNTLHNRTFLHLYNGHRYTYGSFTYLPTIIQIIPPTWSSSCTLNNNPYLKIFVPNDFKIVLLRL